MDDFDFEDGYFSEVMDEAELTGKEPKFFGIPEMETLHTAMAGLKVDELIRMYIAIRNQLATDRKGYNAHEDRMKTQMGIISMALRDRGDQLGVDNFKTANGTAYRNTKETFTVRDWDSLCKYVLATENFSVLQKRVSPNAVKEAREQDGALIPGVEPRVEIEFAVRSPTARKSK